LYANFRTLLIALFTLLASTLSRAESQGVEFYSETIYRRDIENLSTQARLRFEKEFLKDSIDNFKWTGGVHFEKEYFARENQAWIQDSISPSLGLKLQAWPSLQLFSEYRLRLQKSTDSISDPRAGLVFNLLVPTGIQWLGNFEFYGESVLVPRFSLTPVSTVFTRLGPDWILSPYLEIRDTLSPSLELGRSRFESRVGARARWNFERISTSLFIFLPTEWIALQSKNKDPEALLSVGGSW
jgi:hypothetical protein